MIILARFCLYYVYLCVCLYLNDRNDSPSAALSSAMAGHHWSKSVFEPKIAMLCADQGQKHVGAKPSKGKHHMSTNPPNVELINLSLRAHDGSDGSGIESGFLLGFPTFHLSVRVSL